MISPSQAKSLSTDTWISGNANGTIAPSRQSPLPQRRGSTKTKSDRPLQCSTIICSGRKPRDS